MGIASLRLGRQLRGHLRIVFNPISGALLVIAAIVVGARARNAALIDGEGDAVRVVFAESVRIGLLQMSTLTGVAIAAIGGAALGGFLSSRSGEEWAALLEPSSGRRWLLRYLAVLAFVLTAVALAAVAAYTAGVVQSLRLDAAVDVEVGDWRRVEDALLHAPLPVMAFSAMAVGLAALLRGSPAVAAAVAIGGTQALLLLQHLMGSSGDVVVPTAWVARWMDLTSSDFGVAYFWTVGSFDSGRGPAGVGVICLGLLMAAAGWLVVRRAGRS